MNSFVTTKEASRVERPRICPAGLCMVEWTAAGLLRGMLLAALLTFVGCVHVQTTMPMLAPLVMRETAEVIEITGKSYRLKDRDGKQSS